MWTVQPNDKLQKYKNTKVQNYESTKEQNRILKKIKMQKDAKNVKM